jgi:hypothetical protein
MTLEDKQWLDQHPHILGNVRITPEENAMLFAIYNRLTGENKKPTSCGRCVANTKKTIKHYYDQERSNS